MHNHKALLDTSTRLNHTCRLNLRRRAVREGYDRQGAKIFILKRQVPKKQRLLQLRQPMLKLLLLGNMRCILPPYNTPGANVPTIPAKDPTNLFVSKNLRSPTNITRTNCIPVGKKREESVNYHLSTGVQQRYTSTVLQKTLCRQHFDSNYSVSSSKTETNMRRIVQVITL